MFLRHPQYHGRIPPRRTPVRSRRRLCATRSGPYLTGRRDCRKPWFGPWFAYRSERRRLHPPRLGPYGGHRGSGNPLLRASTIALFDDRKLPSNRNRRSFLRDYLRDPPCPGRWNFGVDFISRDLAQRLILVDQVALFHQPLGDGSFDHALAHLGHRYFDSHINTLPDSEVRPRSCWCSEELLPPAAG